MSFKYVLVFVFLLSTSLFGNESVNPSCKTDKRIVGACFKVHGRLSNWNGNPTRRISITGTKRILGVREGTSLPTSLRNKLGDFDDVATDDFEICPLTQEQKGRMRIICIASVSGIKVTKRKP